MDVYAIEGYSYDPELRMGHSLQLLEALSHADGLPTNLLCTGVDFKGNHYLLPFDQDVPGTSPKYGWRMTQYDSEKKRAVVTLETNSELLKKIKRKIARKLSEGTFSVDEPELLENSADLEERIANFS